MFPTENGIRIIEPRASLSRLPKVRASPARTTVSGSSSSPISMPHGLTAALRSAKRKGRLRKSSRPAWSLPKRCSRASMRARPLLIASLVSPPQSEVVSMLPSLSHWA